ETVLFNIVRGTGLSGLAGIPRIRRLSEATTIIRPLLNVTRAEVLQYLQSLGQSYRDDSTNRLENYTRNRIRLQLLPQLERDYNPRVRDALLRLADIAAQSNDFLDQQAESVLSVAARCISGGLELEIKRMAHLHPAIIRHVLFLVWQQQGWPLQDMTFERWQQLVQWCQSSTVVAARGEVFPGGIRVDSAENYLRLTA